MQYYVPWYILLCTARCVYSYAQPGTQYIYNAAPCSGVRSSERYIQPTTRSPGLPKKHRDYSPGVSHCPQLHRNSVRIPRQAKLIFLVIPEKYRPVFEGPYFGKYRFLFSTSVSNTAVCCCLLYTSPSPRDLSTSRMPSSA